MERGNGDGQQGTGVERNARTKEEWKRKRGQVLRCPTVVVAREKKHQAGLTSVVRCNLSCSLPWDGGVTGATLTGTVGGPAHERRCPAKRSWNGRHGVPARVASAVADTVDQHYGTSLDDEVVGDYVPERWRGHCRWVFCASAPIYLPLAKEPSRVPLLLLHDIFPQGTCTDVGDWHFLLLPYFLHLPYLLA